MFLIRQIIIRHKTERDIHVVYSSGKISGYDLFSSAGQLVKVKKAYGFNSFLGITLGHKTRQDRSDRQNQNEYYRSDYRDSDGAATPGTIHSGISLP
jgi:hypothetical protein